MQIIKAFRLKVVAALTCDVWVFSRITIHQLNIQLDYYLLVKLTRYYAALTMGVFMKHPVRPSVRPVRTIYTNLVEIIITSDTGNRKTRSLETIM